MDTATSGTLVVRRPASTRRDIFRAYRIEVDGQTRLTIRRGEEKSLELAPGAHTVRAAIDWTGSDELEVQVSPGSTVTCSVEPAGTAFALWQLLGRRQYLKLSVEP